MARSKHNSHIRSLSRFVVHIFTSSFQKKGIIFIPFNSIQSFLHRLSIPIGITTTHIPIGRSVGWSVIFGWLSSVGHLRCLLFCSSSRVQCLSQHNFAHLRLYLISLQLCPIQPHLIPAGVYPSCITS